MTFSTILAAADFSDASRNAVLRAARLAQQLQARLHVVHVTEWTALDGLRHLAWQPPADLHQKLLAAAHFHLEELADAVRKETGVAAALRVAEGPMLEEIEKAQRDTGAGLTVLGARGASLARRLLLGSTAERLLARATHPMLVVRLPAEVPYRRVLAPVDFSEESLAAVARARTLAPAARITLLHAYEAPYEGKLRTAGVETASIREYVQSAETAAFESMAAFLQQAGDAPGLLPLVVHGNPVVHVLDQEEESGCQLVVVGKGSGHRVEDYLFGSLSRRVLSQSRVDVLLSA